MTVTPARLLMTADAVGGVWTHALDLAAALGTPVTLAVMGPAPDAAQRAAAAAISGLDVVETGLPLDWLATSEAEVVATAHAVAAMAGQVGAMLVQLNSPTLALARFPCPVIGVCHSCLATWWEAVRGGPLPHDFAWRSALLARGYATCDALVAPSHAFAAATARIHGLPRTPEVVWNGRRAGPPARGAEDFAFTAGRLWDAGKDVATLDRAAARLDLPVLAAGPTRGPQGETVAPAHLRLLGNLDAMALRRRLARGPIFVSTARYEPFGLAVLEAAQAGCALVLSDIPTLRELWEGAAVFVAPGDAAGFAAAIAALSQRREQRRRLGVAAMRRARRYGVDAMALGHAAMQRRVLAAPAKGSVAA